MSTAAINGVTGINGSGKTLWLLQHVERMRKASVGQVHPEKDANGNPHPKAGELVYPPTTENPLGGRPVFFYAIPGVKEKGVLPWTELEPFDKELNRTGMEDPMQIYKLPLAAIVVIDEGHRTFGRGRMGADTPAHIVPFDMVRHKGYTFFIVTQRAKDIHPYLRERWGKHYHLRRAWGLEQSSVFEWEEWGDPRSLRSLKEATETAFKFPKEVFNWYTSSDSHTVQKSIPWKKLSVIVWGPLLLIPIGWFIWHELHTGIKDTKPVSSPKEVEQKREVDEVKKAQSALASTDPKKQGPQWSQKFVERVDGMPASAQVYDTTYKARTYPKISGCLDLKTRDQENCVCTTQQGSTIRTMSLEACHNFIKYGWFDMGLADSGESGGSVASSSSGADQPNPLKSIFGSK